MPKIRKFIITHASFHFGVKFNVITHQGFVGGNAQYRTQMRFFLIDYVGLQKIKKPKLHSSIVRYPFSVTPEVFDAAMEKAREHHLLITEVKAHGRLMR